MPSCRQFFLNGKTLPINRKRGTDQPIMHIAAELVRRGDWLHVFPEARGVAAGLGSDNINPAAGGQRVTADRLCAIKTLAAAGNCQLRFQQRACMTVDRNCKTNLGTGFVL